jgi:hypothetical protein
LGLRLAKLVTIDLNSEMVLVRRDVAKAQLAQQSPDTRAIGPGANGRDEKRDPEVPHRARCHRLVLAAFMPRSP